MIGLLIIATLIMLLLNIPIAFSLGIGATAYLLTQDMIPLTLVIQRMFVQVDSFPLMAIPFYMLAGEIMGAGGISRKLVEFAQAMVGYIKGGIGMVAIVSSMLFAGISGSAAADASATGSLLIPAMIRNGYKKGLASVIEATSSCIGPIIPPSVVMIIYGALTGISVGALFLAGFIPGLVIGLMLMILTYFYAKKYNYQGQGKFVLTKVIETFKKAAWALVLPLIIIGGILSGVFTATEAGVVAVVYALFITIFVYKELKFADLEEVFINAAKTAGMIMIIVATAAVFSWILAYEGIPEIVVQFITDITDNRHLVLLLVVAFVLIVGMLVETVSSAIILVPVLAPISQQFGFDPVHFGTVVIIALIIASVTPPVGVILFITNGIAKIKLKESLRYLAPYLLAMFIALLLIMYIPQIVLFIPEIFM